MGIEYDDGTSIATQSWNRLLNLLAQEGKEGKKNPSKITCGGVTVIVKGHKLRKDAKINCPSANDYIEGECKGWTIRVWPIVNENYDGNYYGCNYFKGDDCRYYENAANDESEIFQQIEAYIKTF